MTDAQAASRLRLALEMYEFGEELYRMRMRRENPDATDGEIEARVRTWRVTRRHAPLGDAVGRPSTRFG